MENTYEPLDPMQPPASYVQDRPTDFEAIDIFT